jgi:hypothetical protein
MVVFEGEELIKRSAQARTVDTTVRAFAVVAQLVALMRCMASHPITAAIGTKSST